MIKKIAAPLNIVILFLQQCPKWIQVLVTVGVVYVILVIVVIFIWFLFFKTPQKQKSNVFDNHGKTQLNSRIKKRVDDLYNEIYNEKLKPWIFINTGKPLRVAKHNGSVIQYEGVRFEGTPRLVFWGDNFIPPIIENAIVKAFDQTIEECRKNNIDPKPYVYETNSILTGLIGNVYNHMADIDRKLQGKGNPKNVQRKNVSHEISKMDECLKGHYDAAILLASGNINSTTPEPGNEKGGPKDKGDLAETEQDAKRELGEMSKWYQTNTFKFVVIPLVIALFLGIPAWLSLSNKTDHSTTASTNIFADVSKDGSILRSNNFPWEIRKSNDQDGNILYTIVDRSGDATAVSVVPDNPKYTVYQSYKGMVIKFTCAEGKISNFTVKLKY